MLPGCRGSIEAVAEIIKTDKAKGETQKKLTMLITA